VSSRIQPKSGSFVRVLEIHPAESFPGHTVGQFLHAYGASPVNDDLQYFSEGEWTLLSSHTPQGEYLTSYCKVQVLSNWVSELWLQALETGSRCKVTINNSPFDLPASIVREVVEGYRKHRDEMCALQRCEAELADRLETASTLPPGPADEETKEFERDMLTHGEAHATLEHTGKHFKLDPLAESVLKDLDTDFGPDSFPGSDY